MSDQVNKAYQATPATTLEQQIMDPNFPKNEREWWAADRIAQLEAALQRIDRMEVYEADAAVVLWAKIGIMRDIARAALEEPK
jgi:hypothetical protein